MSFICSYVFNLLINLSFFYFVDYLPASLVGHACSSAFLKSWFAGYSILSWQGLFIYFCFWCLFCFFLYCCENLMPLFCLIGFLLSSLLKGKLDTSMYLIYCSRSYMQFVLSCSLKNLHLSSLKSSL